MWHKSSYLRSLTVIGWCLGLVDRLVESLYHALVGLRSLIVYPNFSSIFKGMMFIADPQSNMILGTGMSSRLPAINKGRLCNLVPSNKSSSDNYIEQHWAVDVSIFATSAWVSSRKDRAVISAFLRSSDRHNASYTLSKEGLFGHDIVFDSIRGSCLLRWSLVCPHWRCWRLYVR